jgi:ATP-binding cassette, subfamily B, bacterial
MISILRRHIPFVRQTARQDCGAACLAMTLRWHGWPVSLAELRTALGSGRDGTSAWAIKGVAERYRLECHAMRIGPDDLPLLTAGAILHWRDKHFVVFERLSKGRVDLLDPALGRRSIDLAAFNRSFAGVALLFTPTGAGERVGAPGKRASPHLNPFAENAWSWVRLLFLSVVVRGLGLVTPVIAGVVVDGLAMRRDAHLPVMVAVVAGAVLVGRALFALLRHLMLSHLAVAIGNRLSIGFMDRLLDLPQAFFDHRSAAGLLARLNSIASVKEVLTSGIASAVLDVTTVVAYLAIFIVAAPDLGLLLLLILAVHAATFVAFGLVRRRVATPAERAASELRTFETDVVSGMETLKANGLERHAFAGWLKRFTAHQRVELSDSKLLAARDAAIDLLRSSAPVVVLLYGARMVFAGQLSLGTLVTLGLIAMDLLGPLGGAVSSVSRLPALRSKLSLLKDVFENEREQEVPGRTAIAGTGPASFQAERVSFRHTLGSMEVIKALSVTVQPGAFVAIVGRSGAGKSTLARLLLGLYQPTAGRILINGISVAELALSATRARFAVACQHPFIFAGTILENLRLDLPDVAMEEVVAAASAACIHEEIRAMPFGYQTRLGRGGAELSGGQRQRIALARALVRRPRALLLDEATSCVDAETEDRVFLGIRSLECTRIVISHRASTVARADRILVLEDGRIVEQGTHEALVRRQGVYHQLMLPQLRAVSPRQREPSSTEGEA